MSPARRLAFALGLAALALPAAEQPRAVIVIRNSQTMPAALGQFSAKFGADACDCLIAGEDVAAERLAAARVIFLEHPTAAFLVKHKETVLAAVRRGARLVTDVPEVVQRGWGIEPSAALTRRLLPYWQNGGEENMLSFLTAVWQEAGGPRTVTVPPPLEAQRQGVYHPDAPRLFASLKEYLGWYRQTHPKAGELVTVNFFHTYLKNRDMAVVDALLHELEARGLAAAGVVGWPHHTLESVFATPPDDPVRVMLTFTLSLAKPEDAGVLEKQNAHVINLMTTRDSYAEWESSERSVAAGRVASLLGTPERMGATEAIMVATTEAEGAGGTTLMKPIAERVRMAAMRARRWVDLGRMPNAGKRIAILYYNNPPGKGNLGASYLNLPPSIHAVLETLGKAGYVTAGRLPDAGQILKMLESAGRNVEAWAPGELQKMVSEGGLTLLPVAQYRRWFDELPPRFRDSINARWGQPEEATLMTVRAPDGRRYFVIPGLRIGNLFLGPQILRASFAEYTNVQHSATLPPHHGYVAAYLWYRHQFKADAVIHMGRHGTLEWLPGKNAGQAGWDCSEVILGDLPNVNYYIMDGGGEAIQARRRGAAVDLSHLTPMLARTGQEERFAPLVKALEQWGDTRETSPMLAREYGERALAEARHLDLPKQLSLDESRPDETLDKLREFANSLEDQVIPLGLPTLGQMPALDRQREGLAAVIHNAFLAAEAPRIRPHTAAWSSAIVDGRSPEMPAAIQPPLRDKVNRVLDDAHGWLARLRASPERELRQLVHVLGGGFLPSGPVGDPIAVPDSLPAGRNLHQGDPALIPTPAAWEVGKRLAAQLLSEHRQRTGRDLERTSMILWSGETGRHQGAMEAQALYLMGVRPEWNARGVVDKLELIPDKELGRPRVNVVFTVSGLYRDGFGDKIVVLDRAARLAASAGDNALSRQNRETEKALVESGVAAAQAKEVAGARVFATAPGSYGFGLQQMVEQSRDKDEPETMAQLYLTKMNYVYSEKTWGATVPQLLQNQLRGNESIQHSRSSNLYGTVDNDDVYQYMGG
ncbi:MAG: cobaltochelatase subunit CobN, partial [Bryobacterales bacterium]|nr:cobaltochelatase subunit CobN [Bryobacterales bacterium]